MAEKAEVVEQVAIAEPVEKHPHEYETNIKSKYYHDFAAALPSAEGKNVVITGTTSGTGFVAARTALDKGAVVALLNRNETKARDAMAEYFEETPGAEERTHFIHCDLQNFASVKEAGEEVSKLFSEGIDVIANNAGVMALEDKSTGDGYDLQMQTNHLSHFMLTRDLFPLLTKRASEKGQARVVNHSSGARLAPSTLKAKYFHKNMAGKLGGNGNSMMTGARWERYHQTKLANSVFTLELQKRCDKAKLNIFSLCAQPGLAATQLQLTTAKEGGLKSTGFMSRAQSQEDGAMGLIRGMLSDKVKKGALYGPRFMTGKATHRYHGILSSSSAGKLLWKESEKACGEFTI